MATKKKRAKRRTTHYVHTKKRKRSDSSIWIRRILSIGVLLLFLGFIIYGIISGFKWTHQKFFTKNPLFEIQHLDLSTDGKLREDQIREYSGISEGTNLFSISFDEIESHLREVSIIEKVYLWRTLPHTLHIKIVERIPMARILGPSTPRSYPYLIDHLGYILPPRLSAKSLPLIKGLNQELKLGTPLNDRDVKIALKIIAYCESDNYLHAFIKIKTLDVKNLDYIDIRLEDGIRVQMPRYSIPAKLKKLATMIKISLGEGKHLKNVDCTIDSPTGTYYTH
jgi:cell division septal protein FtsQ